ncbi:uncharacterized protein LOC131995187 isoform X1 [Stomoxys calcitrans]|uniref:uncharacterized protein LOC131995187 isoform X1 n=1 Tax=Stomoxys calcitrans TaxID=35570 RepID=UPI0027E3AC8A|nr:uncharacterized protein LOC131995187 isoform X1 [Stomoxys calcitrans]
MNEFQDIFHLPGERTTATRDTDERNLCKDTDERNLCQDTDERNLCKGGEAVSPYNSQLLVAPKKSTDGNKKWRLVIEFRRLNNKIVNGKFPLTRMTGGHRGGEVGMSVDDTERLSSNPGMNFVCSHIVL